MKGRILLFIGVLCGSLALPGDLLPSISDGAVIATKESPTVVKKPVMSKSKKVQKKTANRLATTAHLVAPSPRPKTLLPIVDQEDIREDHKLIADEILRMLPEQCRSTLKQFYVRYDNPEQRGLAGKSTAIISGNVPENEFRALLIHEIFGHVVDLGCLTGTPASGLSEFKDGNDPIYNDDPSVLFYRISWTNEKTMKKGMREEDFVSGYPHRSDAFEDLAESVTFYFFHPDSFRERAAKNDILKQKLEWIETYLFPVHPTMATSTYQWNGNVPWDITKLPYIWNSPLDLARR